MYRSSRTAKSVFPSFGTHLVFDDVIQVKYTDEITLVVGNEACDLDSGTGTVADKQTDSKPDNLITDFKRNRELDSGFLSGCHRAI